MVFVRCTLEIQRQDILYVVIFGVVTIVILMIPVCVLMISMIRAVVTQHKMIQLIYQDAAENRRKERKLRSEIDFDQLYSYANAAQAYTKCQDEHRITFFDEELLEEQLWERKVDDFVAKPIEMKEICNCIRKWLPRELIVKIRNKEQSRIAAGIQKAAELKADIRQGEKLKWKGIDKLAGIKASGNEKLCQSVFTRWRTAAMRGIWRRSRERHRSFCSSTAALKRF